jgi:hypothetical protein
MAQMGNVGTTLGAPVLALLLGGFGGTGFVVFIAPLSVIGYLVVRQLEKQRAAG